MKHRHNIDFEGIVNCRDLGGIPLPEGREVRRGVFYRSETPQAMTEADVARAIDELGVTRVLDIRGRKMRGHDNGGSGPLGADGRWVLIDFFAQAGGIDSIDESPDGFLSCLLDVGGPALATCLEEIVQADGAVFLHCHTGKDRTGFVAAMILALLGASDDDIRADYLLTADVFDRMMQNLRDKGLGVPDNAPVYAHHCPSPASIDRLLTRLRGEYASPADWATTHGIDQSLIDRLRDHMIADSATQTARRSA
ncbi:MAG: tyrosine-protein phosphatase [Rhodobacterales bacterium]|nr:tyrosine-protein phosphatase [Rhodobacterales bacterium]